jgi:hypothetical protein
MLKNQQPQNLSFDRTLTGTVVPGYGVASGRSADSPYPAGTIAMQAPLFRALAGWFHTREINSMGLDLYRSGLRK